MQLLNKFIVNALKEWLFIVKGFDDKTKKPKMLPVDAQTLRSRFVFVDCIHSHPFDPDLSVADGKMVESGSPNQIRSCEQSMIFSYWHRVISSVPRTNYSGQCRSGLRSFIVCYSRNQEHVIQIPVSSIC